MNCVMDLVDKGHERATVHRKDYRRQLHERSDIWDGISRMEIILICGDDGKEPSKQSQNSPGQCDSVGWRTVPYIKRSQVRFPVRAHA